MEYSKDKSHFPKEGIQRKKEKGLTNSKMVDFNPTISKLQ